MNRLPIKRFPTSLISCRAGENKETPKPEMVMTLPYKLLISLICWVMLAGVSEAGIDFSITNVTNPDYNFLIGSHFKTKKEARKFASQYKGDPSMIKRIEDRIKVLEAIGDPSGQLKYFKVALENLRNKGANINFYSKPIRRQ